MQGLKNEEQFNRKVELNVQVKEMEQKYGKKESKSKTRRLAQTPSTGTLRPAPEESVNWYSTGNLFIESDNLEVLKLLQKFYHKIEDIYSNPGEEYISFTSKPESFT